MNFVCTCIITVNTLQVSTIVDSSAIALSDRGFNMGHTRIRSGAGEDDLSC